LPFVADPVSASTRLSRALDGAFGHPMEPLAADSLVVELAEGLLDAERRGPAPRASQRVDAGALERARRFLDAERTRVVRSAELESVTGLTRYDLARQFRATFGTSPYRYLIMRRLALARELIHQRRALADTACEAGFADQAHFTRAFKSAFGLTPARYRALRGGQRV
jgi:AraC-like DNA-binding protein